VTYDLSFGTAPPDDDYVPPDEPMNGLTPRELADATGRPQGGLSWQPLDLGPVLRGEHKRASPTLGVARSDGLRLIYPGKEHSVIGEMESGKSWFCLACCAAELVESNPVLYVHFEESDPTDTVERLLLLGVPDGAILDLFRFVAPDEPVTPEWLAALLDPAPVLVVLDGQNEGMSLHGQGIRDEDGAAAFRRRLVKPCTAVGAAVLACDHVVKDREARGRHALGSVHKGNGLTGALILLENAEAFGRGQRGRSHVYITKDRPGALRRHGRAEKSPGKTFMGELVVDDTRERVGWLDLTFWAPNRASDATDSNGSVAPERGLDDEADDIVFAAVQKLTAADQPASTRSVRAVVPFGNEKVADALMRLTLSQRLATTTGPRNARLYSLPSASRVVSGPGSKEPGTARPLNEPVPNGPETTQDHSGPVTE
jgi:hypothetical protein